MSEESDNQLSRREFLVYSTAAVAASGLVARTDALANQDPQEPGAMFINDGSHTIYGYS